MAAEIPGVTPHKKSNLLKIIGISVAVFVVFVFAIISFVFSIGSAPMKAGEAFVTGLSGGQVDQAYETASIQFKQTVSKDQFQSFLSNYPILTKVNTASFNSFSIENNFATVSGTLTGTDGQVSPIKMQLVNENGAWRVLNMDLNPPAPGTSTGGVDDTSSVAY